MYRLLTNSVNGIGRGLSGNSWSSLITWYAAFGGISASGRNGFSGSNDGEMRLGMISRGSISVTLRWTDPPSCLPFLELLPAIFFDVPGTSNASISASSVWSASHLNRLSNLNSCAPLWVCPSTLRLPLSSSRAIRLYATACLYCLRRFNVLLIRSGWLSFVFIPNLSMKSDGSPSVTLSMNIARCKSSEACDMLNIAVDLLSSVGPGGDGVSYTRACASGSLKSIWNVSDTLCFVRVSYRNTDPKNGSFSIVVSRQLLNSILSFLGLRREARVRIISISKDATNLLWFIKRYFLHKCCRSSFCFFVNACRHT